MIFSDGNETRREDFRRKLEERKETRRRARESEGNAANLEVTDVGSLEWQPVEWLWEDRIPLGAITLLAGRPGVGKSTLTYSLAARLSAGRLTGKPEQTLLLNAEDHRNSVIKSRLEAAKADESRVLIVNRNVHGVQLAARIPDDIPELARIAERRSARLIIIDPLNAHLRSNIDSWKDQSIRTGLAPLQKMAEDAKAAVVVVGHLNKGQGSDPLQRIGGSIGLTAAARSVLLFGNAPDDPEGEAGGKRVLAHVKTSSGKLAPSLAFEIEEVTLAGRPGQTVAVLKQGGEVDITASELLSSFGSNGVALSDAMDFLRSILAAGPCPSSRVSEQATQLGIAERTLTRARKTLKIITYKEGSTWYMKLPTTTDGQAQP